MREWTAYIATRRHRRGGDVSDADLVAFAEQLQNHAGVAAGDCEGYDATLTVEADTSATAVSTAETIVVAAAARSGLPEWPVVHAEVIEATEHDRQLARRSHPQLVGVSEIAEMLSVSKQRVAQLIGDHSDFPAPLARLAAGPVWDADAIRVFEENWPRQPGRPPSHPPARVPHE